MRTTTGKAKVLRVSAISKSEAARLVIAYHYMHRRPQISHAYGLTIDDRVVGVVTFGTPASRHMQAGACPTDPAKTIELNRLWVCDSQPRNTESWFLAKAFKLLPPYIVLSYADTTEGHMGHVYRASNFYYAGWTDMDRKTPRLDYVPPAMADTLPGLFGTMPDRMRHSRDAFRASYESIVRRKPKVRYWIVTGDRRERKALVALCAWPKLDWKLQPPPTEHLQSVAMKACAP